MSSFDITRRLDRMVEQSPMAESIGRDVAEILTNRQAPEFDEARGKLIRPPVAPKSGHALTVLVEEQRREIDRLRNELDSLLEAVTLNAPECWADSDPAEGMAVAYVRSLEGFRGDLDDHHDALAGHAPGCDCFGFGG